MTPEESNRLKTLINSHVDEVIDRTRVKIARPPYRATDALSKFIFELTYPEQVEEAK